MLLLHASMVAGDLAVWGEATPEARPGRRPRQPPSPFDPGEERLRAVLDPHAAGAASLPLFAWLPTGDDGPVASSPLVAPPPAEVPIGLSPYRVATLRLTGPRFLDLLAACAGRDVLAPGVVVGATLRFWAAALRLAAALVVRQRFWPALRSVPSGWRACWQAVLTGADAPRAATLARALPPACRALTTDGERAPDTPASATVSAFLDRVADALVRHALDLPAAARPRRPAAAPSLHERWLHALRSTTGEMDGDPAELRRLAEQTRDWQRPVAVTGAAPFRLAFRLEEPDAPDADDPGPWRVRYLLQAADDPSLLVPLADVWKGAPRVLQRGGFAPREHALAALGQAAALDPDVDAALRGRAPAGHDLDAAGAHRFLSERAAVLESGGFAVLLPAWWTLKGTKQHLVARAQISAPKLSGGTGLKLADLVELRWEVALGDQVLTREELEALAKLKQPLVRVRGQWVQLSADEIRAALAFWKQKGTATLTAREALNLALGAAPAPGGLALGAVRAEGAFADLLDRLEGRRPFEELAPPAGLVGELRPYQRRGFSWLAFLRGLGLGACLADDMGLGKTVQTLALLQRAWEEEPGPTLLVCPLSVVGNWRKEAERFTPGLSVLVHHGGERVKGPAFKKEAARHALVLTSYGLLHRDLDLFKAVTWSAVVFDEAQNVKNAQTKQAQAARAVDAGCRVALTGTPVENHVGDLWSLMELLNPGLLGTQAEFRRTFFLPIQGGEGGEAAARLKRLTGPFVLRRLKTDRSVIADLPAKNEMKVYCTLTREQASLYAAVVKELTEALAGAEGIRRKGLVLGALSKLKQVCNHPAHFLGDNSALPGRSGKLERLTEMLEEVTEAGDRALIFTQFTEMGGLLQRHLQEAFGREVPFLHGGVTKKGRDALVERFQGGGDGPRLFLLSLKAGGTGLNLTAASHVFHFDRWWNPAVEDQVTDRAFRIGQRRDVQVHKFLCAGTLEERIDDMIERKKRVAGMTVGAGEAWLTELSTEELKDVFALRREALGE